jgi:hypothetical protein
MSATSLGRAARLLPLVLVVGAVLCGAGLPRAAAGPRPLRPEDQARVDQAITRGVAFLKRSQARKGTWDTAGDMKYKLGYTLLPGLALLESGVPADDPAVKKVAALARQAGRGLTKTYDLALAILFLDRLDDPQDNRLIESLALRLLAGQCRSGGWCYSCPTMSEPREKELRELLARVRQRDEPAGGAPEPLKVPDAFRALTIFHNPAKLPTYDTDNIADPSYDRLFTGATDGSNTQFALLALWVARRRDVPLTRTFDLAFRRLESTQNPDGSWSYRSRPGGGPWYPTRPRGAITAAGLLGLAIREGLRSPARGAAAAGPDAQILNGFAALSRVIDEPTGQMARPVPSRDFYFLWSVERVAMLYDLPTVGGKDWYRWGAEVLVTNQADRGDWPGGPLGAPDFLASYGPTVNTSFALLFLKRSNLAKDLTAGLPFKPEELDKGVVAAAKRLEGAAKAVGLPATPSPGETSRSP